jgi:hypothetical protein
MRPTEAKPRRMMTARATPTNAMNAMVSRTIPSPSRGQGERYRLSENGPRTESLHRTS